VSVEAPLRLYLGCYTSSSGGHGSGVSVLERPNAEQPWKAIQVAPVDDPSFIALTEGELHAASETTVGRLVSFTVSGGVLEPASIAASGGTAPCHVLLDPVSGSLVVTNYSAGTFAILSADALDPARVARVLPLPAGHGTVPERQSGPHAHSSTATPWGTLLVSDLGTDHLYEIRVDPTTLEPSFVAAHRLPAGTGPRHFAWLGEQLVVAGELDGRLHVLSHSDDVFVLEQSVEAVDLSVPRSTGEVLLSHVAVHAGRVYAAVRGRDTIAVLEPVVTDGVRRLTLVAEVPCGGRWPRHFAIAGAELYVANQLSDTVSILPLDAGTGIPGAPVALIETGSPACVVFDTAR
jgi:6-phosphogluconolactonase (cycloisomerase 2 family)